MAPYLKEGISSSRERILEETVLLKVKNERIIDEHGANSE